MVAESNQIAAILLAAGGSSRLGQPKQLVTYKGKTLIRSSAEKLIDCGCSPVIVVLGAETENSAAELIGMPVSVMVNEEWRDGISSSIQLGIKTAQLSGCEAALISLCDQPFVSVTDLVRLIDTFVREEKIIASAYANGLGVPAIFPRRFFALLTALTGDAGARKIIASHRSEVVPVAVDTASVDIDTIDDLKTIR